MITTYLVLLASTLTIVSSMTGMSEFMFIVDAQTPSTSDLPSTIGNESPTDKGLTNNTLPVENTTTIIPLPSL